MKTALLIFLLSGQSLDITSTLLKLHQGCHEANPFFKSVHLTTGPRIVMLKGGFVVGFTYSFEKTYPAHPGIASALALITGGSGVAAAVHNMEVSCH